MQPQIKQRSFELSSHTARVGMKSSAGYVRAFHYYCTRYMNEICTASSLQLSCFLFSAVPVVCRHSVGKKSHCTLRARGFRQIVALEHVRRRLFCLLAASVRAPDKTGHPFLCFQVADGKGGKVRGWVKDLVPFGESTEWQS